MNQSFKVRVNPETIKAAEAPLTFKRKQELRRENIIAYIKSRPLGARIKMEEFKTVGNFATEANAFAFIKVMVKHKLIFRENLSPRTYCYSVPEGQVRVTRAANRAKKPTSEEIENLAMRFSWENPENYNDLHKFVDWVKGSPAPLVVETDNENEDNKRLDDKEKSPEGL